jgi:hypothetical protein
MWRVALGIAVLLQAGATRADDKQSQESSAVHVDCPADSPDEDCSADEAVVPEAPPAAPAPAATAVAPAPTTFATVTFRNDVGKKLRLVEAHFTMDGEKLPVVLTSAEPGTSHVIASGPMKPGPHIVSARLTYQGDRGVFSYMKGYKLNVHSDQLLTAPADRPVRFTVVGSENKGMTVPLEKRVVVTVEGAK